MFNKPNKLFLFNLSLIMFLAGCGNVLDKVQTKFAYEFDEQKTYRINASYESSTQLTKAHQKHIFSRDHEIINVKSTYHLKADKLSPEIIKVSYFLQHISLNDNKGKIRIELGPVTGQLAWYEELKSLETYLGDEGFRQYKALLQQPIATILINQKGEQLNKDEATGLRSEVRLDILECLGKNRIIGKYIIKAFKIPPVLMTIFPDNAVSIGSKWTYNGQAMGQQDEWQQSLETNFSYKEQQAALATILYESDLVFSSEELNQLRSDLGINAMENMSFKKGNFGIKGKMNYNIENRVPHAGEMEINKYYSFLTNEEEWSFEEKEIHHFQLEIEK